MLGTSGWRMYRYVLLPASLPALASSLRQGFSFAWRSLMGAELIFAVERHGLGFVLHIGRELNDVGWVVDRDGGDGDHRHHGGPVHLQRAGAARFTAASGCW